MSVSQTLAGLPSVRSLDLMTPTERRATMREVTDAITAAQTGITARAQAAARDLLASEQRDFDTLSDTMRRYEEAERALRLAEEETTMAARGRLDPTVTYRSGVPLAPGQSVGGYVRARGLAEHAGTEPMDFGRALRGIATGDWRGAEAEHRAMNEGTTTAGGYLVPTILSAQLIDMARAATAVGKVGAQTVVMENQKLDVGKWTADPTAAWRNEAATITASDPTIGKVTLTAQSLAAHVVVSREVLEDVPGLSGQLATAFAAAFALKLDLAALRGTGSAPEPRGVKNTVGITTTSLGTNGAAFTWDHVIDGVGVLADANEQVSGVVYHPRAGRSLGKAKDSTGQYLTPPAAVAGVPRAESTQLPVNLTQGSSSDCSEVYIGDFRQLLIGIRTQLLISPLVERYAETGQVGFIAWMRADVAVARPAAFNLLTGVRP